MKPVIAITVESKHQPENARARGEISLNWNYFQAISAAGGNPIVLTPTTDLAEIAPLLDGWVIPGGADIHPSNFGQELHPDTVVQDPSRFETEINLHAFLPPEVPILGICYGCQFLNVAEGGDLVQHLPDVTNVVHTGGPLQEYKVAPDSVLAQSSAYTGVRGESWHHQAVGRVAEGWRAVAHADDGTIEAIEQVGHPFRVGVQWHPERTAVAETVGTGDPAMRSLFRAFVEACTRYRKTKRSAG